MFMSFRILNWKSYMVKSRTTLSEPLSIKIDSRDAPHLKTRKLGRNFTTFDRMSPTMIWLQLLHKKHQGLPLNLATLFGAFFLADNWKYFLLSYLIQKYLTVRLSFARQNSII